MATKSHKSARDHMVAAQQDLHPWPDTIEPSFDDPDRALRIYQDAQANRCHDHWAAGDLQVLAQYARTMTDLECAYRKLQVTGDVVMGGKHGATPVASPYARIVADLQSQCNALGRRLNIITSVAPHSNRQSADEHARREQEARRVLDRGDDNVTFM